ncbi:hypothetical protein CC79DRAFT_1320943 [Sarocladium strictum]
MAEAVSNTVSEGVRPTVWPTLMVVAGNGEQTQLYGSFVSATAIASKTHQEVFEVSCEASQCSGTAFPKQTVTQNIEMYVCPGDSSYCPESLAEDGAEKTTWFGYPLGYAGQVTADGTTTEWEMKLSILRDDERSAGATGADQMTWVATTKVGKDVKETFSTVEAMDEDACRLYDNYAFVEVTAGVKELLADYPDQMFPVEPLTAADFNTLVSEQRARCAKKTSGANGPTKTDAGSAPAETTGSASNDDGDDKGDEDGASTKMSLSFILMGALLAVSVLIP